MNACTSTGCDASDDSPSFTKEPAKALILLPSRSPRSRLLCLREPTPELQSTTRLDNRVHKILRQKFKPI